MPSLHEACRRHAEYFLDVLQSAEQLYGRGGDAIQAGLILFESEWGNIRLGHKWSVEKAEQDDAALRLCNTYPGLGANCLELRLSPAERRWWYTAALSAARHLQD